MRRFLLALGFFAVCAAVMGALALVGLYVRGAVGDAGAFTLVALVGLYAALSVAMFPGSVLTSTAGAMFGALVGTALTLAAATLGASVAFMLGRRSSRRSVESIAGPRLRRADDHLRRSTVSSILMLRLVPLVPFNVLGYAAGASSVRMRHYVAGTVLGILPVAFAFASASAGAAADEPTSAAFIGAVAVMAVLAAGGVIAAPRLARSRSPLGDGGEAPAADPAPAVRRR